MYVIVKRVAGVILFTDVVKTLTEAVEEKIEWEASQSTGTCKANVTASIFPANAAAGPGWHEAVKAEIERQENEGVDTDYFLDSWGC